MQRNKGLMYCFVEVDWEVFSHSFAAQAISLAFSGPFFGQFGVCAATRISHTKKTFTFYKLLPGSSNGKKSLAWIG